MDIFNYLMTKKGHDTKRELFSSLLGKSTGLPSEYQRVDYIKSSGTQYIDTGISNTKYLKAYLDTECVSSATASEILFARSVSVGRWFGRSSAGVYTAGTGAVSNVNCNLRKQIKIVFEASAISFIIDGTTYSRSATADDTNRTYTILAGKSASTGEANYYAKAKIYDIKLYDNGKSIMNLIPCYRKSDNEVGMYDTVSETFFTNQGSGSFTYGSEV